MRHGAHAYRRVENSAMSPREVEAAAFGYVNRMLGRTDDPAARMQGLVRNQQLWSLLLRDLGSSGNRLPETLRADLVRLGAWALRATIAAMGAGTDDAGDVEALLRLNEDMIAALRTAPAVEPELPAPAMAREASGLVLAG